MPADNQRRQFGNLIMSRYPILSSRHFLLPKIGSIDALSIQRSIIEATIDCDDVRLRIYSVHLCHLSTTSRLQQVDRLLEIHRQAVHEGAAMSGDLSGIPYQSGINEQKVPYHAIMMGDFNCQPDSREYERIVGPSSDYGGRLCPEDGFVDAWTAAGHARDQGHTGEICKVPVILDYCFLSPAIRHRVQHCSVDISATGSDHYPLWTEIDLQG